ncbi:MAG TPA: vitamin B12 dependent-methionine synthase activation domain-containing protein [Ignavibacteriaceae bacterium]|nr:vitamin B12 dependent-methionine synthase activation domain-containing protein [Ignavibacteriaceae bacterium]
MQSFKAIQDDPQLLLSDPFIYRIHPIDYIALTESILKNPKLFQEIDSAKEKEDKEAIAGFSGILSRWKNIPSKEELKRNFRLICRDFEIYKYFYKEVGASLKFNPLSQRQSGIHLLETMSYFLKEYLNLINPKALFTKVEFTPDEEGLKLDESEIHFNSRKLKIFTSHSSKTEKEITAKNFKADKVVVYIVTIGPGLDNKVKSLAAEGDIFEAYLLNGIGAGAAEMAAKDLNLYINDHFGNGTSYKRLSPGYGDWPVSDQGKIFKLLNPEKNIGVKLTDSFIMLPEKSTSGIMGLID